MNQRTILQVSVRELVAFVLRSGDLGAATFISASRAVEGTRGHQFVQDQRPDGYEAEVSITYLYQSAPISLEISGRADGVLFEDDVLLIEEIKTTYGSIDAKRPDNPHHWAQAKLYAHVLAVERRPSRVVIQLTYVQLDTGRLKEDRREFSLHELSVNFEELVERYLRWVGMCHRWRAKRDASIATLHFPYPDFRPGQQELSSAVYETIVSGSRLYAQAPTGIGKTVSVLFPAVQTLGEGAAEKIFYLTAKTSGRTVAEQAFDDLRTAGLAIKSVTLTARDRICFNATDVQPCDPQTCEYALGYYDRVNDAIGDAFASRDDFTCVAIEAIARKHTVCPFELSLDLSLVADAVICDYNYLFDPKAYLKRYFLDSAGDYAFLVDEAHNLVERAREMYSAELQRRHVRSVAKAVRENHDPLARALDAVDEYLKLALARCEIEGDGSGWMQREVPEDLIPLLRRVRDEGDPILSQNRPTSYRQELTDLFFTIVTFLRVADVYDDHYVSYAEKHHHNLLLRLYCLDPSARIADCLRRGKSATFFSATLTPLDYFRQLLGGKGSDYTLDMGSPFPPEHLQVLVAADIDTTFRSRQHSYNDVSAAIAATVSGRQGNYFAYFPSYRYMEEVFVRFHAAEPNVRTLIQVPRMTEPQKEQFLKVFDGNNTETVVGFAVMGGIFGEGIDLVGERLVGAIVVGVGLPQICLQRDLIRGYYNELEGSGFAYAYTYPGMNRVLQAAGRVIRSNTDRGIVLLIDKRFHQPGYREMFPRHWSSPKYVKDSYEIGEVVDLFWSKS
ncbi:MAG: ATP-dependent DNA helicase [Candidatus Latescibacterota bacterium]|nr:ATP-dependent DNA helicase [Candidatus Latescibacterota bacterium]